MISSSVGQNAQDREAFENRLLTILTEAENKAAEANESMQN